MKPESAEPTEDMPIPQRGVAPPRAHGEVWHRVEPPPLLGELSKRLLAGAEQVDLPCALPPHDLSLERLGVALAPDDLRVRAAARVPPAHAPHDTALPLHPLDAHRPKLRVALMSASMGRKLPRAGGTVLGTTFGCGRERGSTLPLIHRSRSSGRTRSRLQRRAAASSPRAIARYTACRERPQTRATCSGEAARRGRPGRKTYPHEYREHQVPRGERIGSSLGAIQSPPPHSDGAQDRSRRIRLTDLHQGCSGPFQHLVQVCAGDFRGGSGGSNSSR